MATGKTSGSSSIRDQQTGETAQVGTKTGGEKALHVIADIENTSSEGSSYSNTYNVYTSDTKIDLNNINNPHTVLYSYSGSGKFISTVIRFNDEDVFIRLVIDGVEVFDIDCDILEGFDLDKEESNIFCGVKWSKDRNVFVFCPGLPISYNASVSIEARANSSSTSRDMNDIIVEIVKD